MAKKQSKKAPAAQPTQSEIVAELQRIYSEHNALKPTIVVAEAEPEEAVLHPSFEWDNSKAGHEYRLEQARRLIRVVVPIKDNKPDRFIHVPSIMVNREGSDREGEYHPISVVAVSMDRSSRALAELEKRVASSIAAAEELKQAIMESDAPDAERIAKIAMAITALQTAGAAVSALH